MKVIFHEVSKKYLIALSMILLMISGCGKSPDKSGLNGNSDFLKALWITDDREWPKEDSLMYGDFPAPVFRKEFILKGEVKSAILNITAAGYYKASINGKPIGKNILDPAWTDFSKRIYYSEYEITSDLLPGKNCLGTTLGNGFYNLLPMKMWSTYNLRDYLPVGKPMFIASLKITYITGEIEEVNTNSEWKYSYGPVIRNSVYLGEVFDAGREIKGWNTPDFDDKGWKNSVVDHGPGGKLQKAFFPAVQITGKCKPVSILSTEKNRWIADMGVNFTGLYTIKLRGSPATQLFYGSERDFMKMAP